MSYSEIILSGKDGTVINRVEFCNAYGFVPFVYCNLVTEYSEHLRPLPQCSLFTEQWNALWEWLSVSSAKLPAFEMNTLAVMGDNAYVRGAEHILRLARSFEMFEGKYFVAGRAHHLSAMAAVMRKHVQVGAEYVAFYPNSVGDNYWHVGTNRGGYTRRLINFASSRDRKNVGATRVFVAPADGPDVSLGVVVE